jgi:AmmeMemoRadiSam system protein A
MMLLDPTARRDLLARARAAILAQLDGRPEPQSGVTPVLQRHAGAFVTVSKAGELRGCVGFVEAARPLIQAVTDAARRAVVDDRFAPVTRAELADLRLEISVLTPLSPIAPQDVVVGSHGLLIRHAGRSGLLLPQVAVEHAWDREAFLDHTCRKAGLPSDSWKQPGVELLGFEAEVFAEEC